MKKVVKSFILMFLLIAMGTFFTGCNASNAIWLQDGQTLRVIDNTLGEGRPGNIRVVHTFTNSTVTEARGYIYILPVSESNPTVRYFASIRQGERSANTRFVEITNVECGDILDSSSFTSIIDFWGQGLTFADGTNTPSTTEHFSSVVTTTRYRYAISRNNNITIWGERSLAVTINSSVISEQPISFTIEIPDFRRVPLLLSHEGDSWEIIYTESSE